jgi:predicted Fe-S protein YdhL (DUF1289 family)
MKAHLLKPFNELSDDERAEWRTLTPAEREELLREVLGRIAPDLLHVAVLVNPRASQTLSAEVETSTGRKRLIVDVRPDGRGGFSLHYMGVM